MAQCNISNESFQRDLFPGLKRRKIEVNFKGGEVTSDGGMAYVLPARAPHADRTLKNWGVRGLVSKSHN